MTERKAANVLYDVIQNGLYADCSFDDLLQSLLIAHKNLVRYIYESEQPKDKSECYDTVSRQSVLDITAETGALETQERVRKLPSVKPVSN